MGTYPSISIVDPGRRGSTELAPRHELFPGLVYDLKTAPSLLDSYSTRRNSFLGLLD